jgi:L-asparagine transporter-like permease
MNKLFTILVTGYFLNFLFHLLYGTEITRIYAVILLAWITLLKVLYEIKNELRRMKKKRKL